MKLGIYTIEKTLFEGEVEEIVLKTTTGEITILPQHIPLISKIESGPITIKEKSGTQKVVTIQSGFLEVQPESKVVILAEE